MHKHTYFMLGCAALAMTQIAAPAATAKSFKAKYYKECYEGVNEVEDLVKPKESLQKKAQKASGLLGTVGSFAGLGGLGGNLSKAANTMEKINRYSGLIDDVSGFSAQMAEEHPDPNERFAAYGTHMSKDAQDLLSVQTAIAGAQTCYNTAYDTVMTDYEAGNLKKSKAKKYIKEIQQGSQATGDVLLNAMNRASQNINSYDQVLGTEVQSYGGGLATMAAGFAGGSAGKSLSQMRAEAAIASGALNSPASVAGAAGLPQYGAVSANTLTGFASMFSSMGAVNAADETAEAADPRQDELQEGLKAVAASSQEYLGLYEGLQGTVEQQRLLELKVNKGL